MQKKIIIACSKKWFFKNINLLKIKKKNLVIIKEKKKLNINNLKKINPKIIFFPHWSYKIKNSILKNFNCICFHAAPLPYGRGGSPIQNLILRKFKNTPICAIKMTNKIDAGPIYLKRNISLSGNLDEIFDRISLKIIGMIKIIINRNISPKKQIGKVVVFKRLKEDNSEIKKNENINRIYDKIRMLSSSEYPNTFIKKNGYKIYLTKPILKKTKIYCEAKIVRIKKY